VKRPLLALLLAGWGGLLAQEAAKPMPAPEAPKSPRTVVVAAVGDTMTGSLYPSREALAPEDGRRVFERVKLLWAGADIVMGNFEGAIATDASQARALGRNAFRYLMPVETLATYKAAGFTFLTIANNHGNDAGPEGRAATIAALDASGLAHGGSLEHPTAVVTVKGVKVGLIGTAPHTGCVPLDAGEVGALVKSLKEVDGCALVVVTMHAGAEGAKATHVPKRKEKYLGADRGDVYAFAHAVVDAGADLVVGHGPHVPRGMEVYRGRLIAYSLGNFATYGAFNLKGVNGLGLVLEAHLREDGVFQGLRIHATRQDKLGEGYALGIPVEPDPEEGARKLIEQLSLKDFRVKLPRHYLPVAKP